MAMTFTTLTGAKTVDGSIKSWANYGKVDAEGVLTDAQAWIYQTLRVREMRSVGALSFSVGDSTKALPTGFLDPAGMMRNTTDSTYIELVSEDLLEGARHWTSGVIDAADPVFYAIFDELVQLDCRVRTAFSARLPYYKMPTALSGSNETNFLTSRYSHILRPACQAFAAAFSGDSERYQTELQRASAFIEDAKAADELSRRTQFEPAEF